jgi:hypothetical protein
LEVVRKYVEDLRQFIDSSELTERKAFITSFVKEIKVLGDEGRIKYTFPPLRIIMRRRGWEFCLLYVMVGGNGLEPMTPCV